MLLSLDPPVSQQENFGRRGARQQARRSVCVLSARETEQPICQQNGDLLERLERKLRESEESTRILREHNEWLKGVIAKGKAKTVDLPQGKRSVEQQTTLVIRTFMEKNGGARTRRRFMVRNSSIASRQEPSESLQKCFEEEQMLPRCDIGELLFQLEKEHAKYRLDALEYTTLPGTPNESLGLDIRSKFSRKLAIEEFTDAPNMERLVTEHLQTHFKAAKEAGGYRQAVEITGESHQPDSSPLPLTQGRRSELTTLLESSEYAERDVGRLQRLQSPSDSAKGDRLKFGLQRAKYMQTMERLDLAVIKLGSRLWTVQRRAAA